MGTSAVYNDGVIFNPPSDFLTDYETLDPSKSKSAKKSSKIENYDANLFEELKNKPESGIDLLSVLNEEKSRISESNIFRVIQAYRGPSLDRFNDYPNAKPHYTYPYIGVKQDLNYCDIVDTYNLLNPDNIFKTKNFVGDYIPKSNIFLLKS